MKSDGVSNIDAVSVESVNGKSDKDECPENCSIIMHNDEVSSKAVDLQVQGNQTVVSTSDCVSIQNVTDVSDDSL